MHSWVCTSWDVDVVVPRSIWPEMLLYFVFSFFVSLQGDLLKEEEEDDLLVFLLFAWVPQWRPLEDFTWSLGFKVWLTCWVAGTSEMWCFRTPLRPTLAPNSSKKKNVLLILPGKVFPAETLIIGIKCPLFLKGKKGKENEKLLISVQRAPAAVVSRLLCWTLPDRNSSHTYS